MQSGEDLTKGIVAAVPSESRKILIVLQSRPVYRFIPSNSTVALSFGNDYGFFVGKDSRQAQGQRLTTKGAALIDIDKVLMRALGPATFQPVYYTRRGNADVTSERPSTQIAVLNWSVQLSSERIMNRHS